MKLLSNILHSEMNEQDDIWFLLNPLFLISLFDWNLK